MPQHSEFDIGLPFRVLSGPGSMAKAASLIAGLGRRALIACGRSTMRKLGVLDRLKGLLVDAGLEVAVFDGIEPDPSTDTVDAGVAAARRAGADVFVGLGGGSVLDATKSIAMFADADGSVADFVEVAPGSWKRLNPSPAETPTTDEPFPLGAAAEDIEDLRELGRIFRIWT